MSHKKEKAPLLKRSFKMVDRRGLEPRTLGLRVFTSLELSVILYARFDLNALKLLCFLLSKGKDRGKFLNLRGNLVRYLLHPSNQILNVWPVVVPISN